MYIIPIRLFFFVGQTPSVVNDIFTVIFPGKGVEINMG